MAFMRTKHLQDGIRVLPAADMLPRHFVSSKLKHGTYRTKSLPAIMPLLPANRGHHYGA